MAKRRKKAPKKAPQLSSADKSNLRRILAKVRAIGAAKKAAAAANGPSAADIQALQKTFDGYQANFNRFITTANPTSPSYQNTFKVLAQQVATAQANLLAAQIAANKQK